MGTENNDNKEIVSMANENNKHWQRTRREQRNRHLFKYKHTKTMTSNKF